VVKLLVSDSLYTYHAPTHLHIVTVLNKPRWLGNRHRDLDSQRQNGREAIVTDTERRQNRTTEGNEADDL
jgi:hypothetical protein